MTLNKIDYKLCSEWETVEFMKGSSDLNSDEQVVQEVQWRDMKPEFRDEGEEGGGRYV
jgi:hypothetical protein